MLHDEDRELQIELTRLQIKHGQTISAYTIFLSVIVSLMLAIASVYVPLAVATNTPIYIVFSLVFDSILVIPLLWITSKMKESKKQLEKEIQELKNKYTW